MLFHINGIVHFSMEKTTFGNLAPKRLKSFIICIQNEGCTVYKKSTNLKSTFIRIERSADCTITSPIIDSRTYCLHLAQLLGQPQYTVHDPHKYQFTQLVEWSKCDVIFLLRKTFEKIFKAKELT